MSRLPHLSSRELLRFLERQGFVRDRQTGSHVILKSPDGVRRAIVPFHGGRDLGRGMLMRILSDAGYSEEDYIRLS